MTAPIPDPAEQTAAAVTAEFPGLRQAHPHSIGEHRPLSAVQLDGQTARYRWGPYDVHVTVGHEAHLDTDTPESTSLQRQIRAHATLLIHEVVDASTRGHVEWDITNPRPELIFPAAFSAAAADQGDPRFASAVLATVAKALEYARIATPHAQTRAAEAAEEAQWERERPEGTSRLRWMRAKRAERDARSAAGNQ